jgi:AcrR family transcriptional regulator
MNPNPKEVRDQMVHDAKTNLILDAALKVFSDKGYHEARLEDIAAAAGFSKASLYNYYEDKEAIFLQILIRMHEKIIEVLKTEIVQERHIKDNLTAMLRAIFKIYIENFSFSMSMADLKSTAPSSLDKFQKHHQELMAKFKQYSKQMIELSLSVFSIARQRGEIATSIDDKTLSQFLTSLIRGILFDCKNTGKIGDIEISIRNIMDFISNGMGFTVQNKQVG